MSYKEQSETAKSETIKIRVNNGSRIDKTGSISSLVKELEELHYRVKYLGHADELTVTTLENLIERLGKFRHVT